jgi:hypothetical protein
MLGYGRGRHWRRPVAFPPAVAPPPRSAMFSKKYISAYWSLQTNIIENIAFAYIIQKITYYSCNLFIIMKSTLTRERIYGFFAYLICKSNLKEQWKRKIYGLTYQEVNRYIHTQGKNHQSDILPIEHL